MHNGNQATATNVEFYLFGIRGLTSYLVPGEGTWSYNNGILTFTPLSTFKGNPTPATYTILDKTYDQSTNPNQGTDYSPGSQSLSGTNNTIGGGARATVCFTYLGNPITQPDYGSGFVCNPAQPNPIPVAILANDTIFDNVQATPQNVSVQLFDNYEVEVPGNTYNVYVEGVWDYIPS